MYTTPRLVVKAHKVPQNIWGLDHFLSDRCIHAQVGICMFEELHTRLWKEKVMPWIFSPSKMHI